MKYQQSLLSARELMTNLKDQVQSFSAVHGYRRQY